MAACAPWLAAGDVFGYVRLLDLAGGAEHSRWTARAQALSLAFSSDGSSLYVGTDGSGLFRLRVPDLAVEWKGSVQASTDRAFSVACSPDGQTVAVGGGPGWAGPYLCSTSDMQLLWCACRGRTSEHERVVSLAFSGSLLAVGRSVKGPRGRVEVWNMQTRRRVAERAGPHDKVAFTPDSGGVVARQLDSGKVDLLRLSDGRLAGLNQKGILAGMWGSELALGSLRKVPEPPSWVLARDGGIPPDVPVPFFFGAMGALCPDGKVVYSDRQGTLLLRDLTSGARLWGEEDPGPC